jgi:hypothetical protein
MTPNWTLWDQGKGVKPVRDSTESLLGNGRLPPIADSWIAQGAGREPRDGWVSISDNEERFSLGGAAHTPTSEGSAVGAAPVSEKRVGLNRSPGPSYGR